MIRPDILYEDAELIVVKKPAGVDAQESRGSAPDMVSILKNHLLSTQISTPAGEKGNSPYIAVVHRLDRQVGGVMVYAKTREAAAHLSKQVQDERMEKTYLAVLCGQTVEKDGTYVDYLWKDGKNNLSAVVDDTVEGARLATLSWEAVERIADPDDPYGGYTLVRVFLQTGRHHQIRVQFASRGLPLEGDVKYNPAWQGRRSEGPALFAEKLSFIHPGTGRRMTFRARPDHSAFRRFHLQDEPGEN